MVGVALEESANVIGVKGGLAFFVCPLYCLVLSAMYRFICGFIPLIISNTIDKICS